MNPISLSKEDAEKMARYVLSLDGKNQIIQYPVKMKKLILFLAVVALLQACDSNKDFKRPRDPWVFRSVLDKQPRIITATLNQEMFVAYDARYCGLYKAWKVRLSWTGQFIQPIMVPHQLPMATRTSATRLQEPAWRLVADGNEITPRRTLKDIIFGTDKWHSASIWMTVLVIRRMLKLRNTSSKSGRTGFIAIL